MDPLFAPPTKPDQPTANKPEQKTAGTQPKQPPAAPAVKQDPVSRTSQANVAQAEPPISAAEPGAQDRQSH